jgi:hypothetical protein
MPTATRSRPFKPRIAIFNHERARVAGKIALEPHDKQRSYVAGFRRRCGLLTIGLRVHSPVRLTAIVSSTAWAKRLG